MSHADRVIVALDTPGLDEVRSLVGQLEGLIRFYKIGYELFTAHGWEAVELVRKTGAEIFLDLKFHDIPNTVARAASVVCGHGVRMFNVHALGGLEMMQRAREAVDRAGDCPQRGLSPFRPVLLGVTVLTSHSEPAFQNELGISRKIQDQVLALAALAKKAGLDGVVSSPQEIEILRKEFGPDFVIVTPGIRTADRVRPGSDPGLTPSTADDQKRTLSPREAFDLGASYIVVGRPITAAPDPREAAQKLLSGLV